MTQQNDFAETIYSSAQQQALNEEEGAKRPL